jgi:hypothetical protein
MERRCPGPCPTPKPNPQPDPEPQPIDDNGPPNVDPDVPAEPPLWALVLVCISGVLVGMGGGYGKQFYAKLNPPVK